MVFQMMRRTGSFLAAQALALFIMNFWRWTMAKPSAVTVFLAASSLLLALADLPVVQAQDGGLKEWSTDQAVDEDSVMNEEAEALLKKAEQEDVCVPIGEGENCW